MGQPPAAGGVRVGTLGALPELLRESGVAPGAIFRRVGVPLRAFGDAETRLPAATLGRLLAECAAAVKRPEFGLLVGARADLSSLGVVGYAMRHSASVQDALRTLVRHLHLHDNDAVVTLTSVGVARLALVYVIRRAKTPGLPLVYDAALAVGCNIMRALCGARWKALQIRLPHGRPSDLAPYRRIFAAPLVFDAERAAIVFHAHWLKHPITDADPTVRRRLSGLLSDLDASAAATLGERTHRALTGMVVGGTASVERAADRFGLHRRTLHRRLRAEGTGVRAMINEIRYELARQMLSDTTLDLAAIAAALHYSDPTAFSRAFRGWTGIAPSAWRARNMRSASRRASAAG